MPARLPPPRPPPALLLPLPAGLSHCTARPSRPPPGHFQPTPYSDAAHQAPLFLPHTGPQTATAPPAPLALCPQASLAVPGGLHQPQGTDQQGIPAPPPGHSAHPLSPLSLFAATGCPPPGQLTGRFPGIKGQASEAQVPGEPLGSTTTPVSQSPPRSLPGEQGPCRTMWKRPWMLTHK